MAAPKGNKYALGLTNNGRPPVYDNSYDMIKVIDRYFEETEIQDLTITGLALFLGFESRQSFYDYGEKEDFSYIIKRARMVIENKYESSLTESNATGSIFALKNMGWKDKVEQDITTKQDIVWHEERTYETND